MAISFSIITAVRNNLPMLKEAMRSVAGQENVRLEHIIIDGNSTDGTQEFLRSNSNPQLRFISEDDMGIYDALNKGLSNSSNDVIGLLHSDDFFADPKVLSDVEKLFASGADVVYADLVYVSRIDTKRVLRNWKSGHFHPNDLLFGWMPPHPTFFFKRSLLERIGLFSLDYPIAGDYEYMLRFLLKTDLDIQYLPRTIVHMRSGGASNKNFRNIFNKSAQDYRIAKKHFYSPLGTLLFKNMRKISQLIHLVMQKN